jgi:uncharacterized protein YecE (DUF72 family)
MDLHIGTSGFSFHSWRAQVYPYALKPEQMFDYYCQKFGFDSVEINSSFYNLPSAKSMESLARRSPPNFSFMAKLYNTFTHNFAEATTDKLRQFREGIAPLEESGKLKGVLAQFPAAYRPGKKEMEWLLQLRDRLGPLPVFMEFRHYLWTNPAVFTFLRKEKIGYCITDLPKVEPLPRFIATVTNGTAYVRLHGRNSEWYKPTTSRYDYQYSDLELQSIYRAIQNISPEPVNIFFFFNNCHAGNAVVSASRLAGLTQKKLAGMG